VRIPRPRGRGPVEAMMDAGISVEPRVIPRPRGRGPVEAYQWSKYADNIPLHSAPARARPR